MPDAAEEPPSPLEVTPGDTEVKLLLPSVCRLARPLKELVGEVPVTDPATNSTRWAQTLCQHMVKSYQNINCVSTEHIVKNL